MKRWLPLLAIIAFFSCRKEVDMPGWQSQWMAPLAYSDMGLGNMIPDSLLETSPDSSLVLMLDQVLYSAGIDSIVPLPDSVFSDTFNVPFTIPLTAGQTFITEVTEKKMDLNGPELTQIILKQGTLDYTIRSRVADTIVVTYAITSATNNGQPVQFTVTVPPGSLAVESMVTGSFNLSGGDFDLRGSSFNDFNTLITSLSVATAPGNAGVSVGPFNLVFLDTKFHNLVASYAKGYFGQQNFPVPYEVVSFDFLKNLQEAVLDIDSVTASLYLTNGVGADARISIDTVQGTNSYYNSSILLSHNQLGVPVNINRATDLGYAAQPYMYTFTMNQSNSNIEPFIENLPDMIGYSGNIEINPLGNVSNHTDFVRHNSKIDVGLKLRVPLKLSASNIVLSDTIPIDLNSLDGNGHFNDMKFRLLAQNGFPLQAIVDITMLDVNKMGIGTIASGLLIDAGILNASNIVIQPSDETKEMYVNAAGMEDLYRAKYLRINVRFQTAGTGKVTFYDYYRFKSKLIVDASYLTRE